MKNRINETPSNKALVRTGRTVPPHSSTLCTLGTIMKRIILLTLFLVSIFGCVLGTTESKLDNLFDPSPDIFRRWQEERSYYALIEIVDAYIDPLNNEATKTDVLKYLGKTYDDGYPNAGAKMWVFPSSRRVPYGAYLIIYFDENDKVEEIGWVSE